GIADVHNGAITNLLGLVPRLALVVHDTDWLVRSAVSLEFLAAKSNERALALVLNLVAESLFFELSNSLLIYFNVKRPFLERILVTPNGLTKNLGPFDFTTQ